MKLRNSAWFTMRRQGKFVEKKKKLELQTNIADTPQQLKYGGPRALNNYFEKSF